MGFPASQLFLLLHIIKGFPRKSFPCGAGNFNLNRRSFILFYYCILHRCSHKNRSHLPLEISVYNRGSFIMVMAAMYSPFHIKGRLSILTVPLVIRLAVSMPTTVYQQRVMGRLELLQPHLKEWTEALKHHVVYCCRDAILCSRVPTPTHVSCRLPSQSERARAMTSTKLISPSR